MEPINESVTFCISAWSKLSIQSTSRTPAADVNYVLAIRALTDEPE